MKYAHTWVTFDEAMAAAQHHRHTGVGFVIPEGWFFLDVDHRAIADPLVQTLLNRFSTYAERAFSGDGFHIYGRCDLSCHPIVDGKLDSRYYTKNPQNGLALYIGGLTNRFAFFTGNAVQDIPLADCTDAILAALQQDMRRDYVPQAPTTATERSAVSDEDISEIVTALRAAKNGNKFRRLYDEGDTTCEDYRDSTIKCGIEACRGVFHHAVMGTPSFIVTPPQDRRRDGLFNSSGSFCPADPPAHFRTGSRSSMSGSAALAKFRTSAHARHTGSWLC